MNKTAFCKKIGKLFELVFVLFLSLSVSVAEAQNSGITLKMQDATVAQVMKAIEGQSQYVFLYNNIDINRRVSIDVRNKGIRETLDMLFKGSDISYKIDSLQILLSKGVEERRPQSGFGSGDRYGRTTHYRSFDSRQGLCRRHDHECRRYLHPATSPLVG